MHLFLDTNSLLHYPPIKDLDWKAVCGCASVRLVLCLQVIHELDEKKNDPRFGDRASRAIKEIKAIRSTGGSVRDGVTLEVFNYEIRAADFSTTLSYDSKDDRIVHSAKKYLEQNPGARVAVYTEDMGMSLRCEANGLAVVEPDPKQRLESPQDELAKKYRQAINELNSLKNRTPAFLIRVVPADADLNDAKNEYELSQSWKPVAVQAELAKVRRAHPRHDAPSEHPSHPVALALTPLIMQEDWERYDRELEKFYASYEAYLHRLNDWGEMNTRTICFDLWLGNIGKSPAEDVDLLLLLPPLLKSVAESRSDAAMLFQHPEPPQPPKKPRPRLPFDARDYLGLMSPITPLTAQIERLLAEREQDKVEVHPTSENGFVIHAKLGRLKHGQTNRLGTFYSVFGDWSEVGSFQAEYTISTSEIPEKVTGKVPFIVRRKRKTGHE